MDIIGFQPGHAPKDLERKLQQMADGVAGRVLRTPVEKAARLVAQSARSKVRGHRRTGRLQKAIYYAAEGISRDIAYGGVDWDFSRSGLKRSLNGSRQRFYGPMVERGTKPHSITSKKRPNPKMSSALHPGSKPIPHMRPAWDENEHRVKRIMRDDLRDEILRNAKR